MTPRARAFLNTASRLIAVAVLPLALSVALWAAPGAASSPPGAGSGRISVRLTWSGDADLDLHVTGLDPDGGRFRAWFMNRSAPGCEFLGDALSGFATESVLIRDPGHGPYQVYVHDFSNRNSRYSDALAESSARVEILSDGALEASFGVPADQPGNQWGVCAVDNGSIIPINHVSDETRASLVGRDPRSTLIPGDIIMGTEPDTNIPTRWSHVGIYAGRGTVIEASTYGLPVQRFSVATWEYPDMTYASYFRVIRADGDIRRRAVEFAEEQERAKKPYDIGFHTKQVDGGSWYCSELVWAAYMAASGGRINIENSPDFFGVYPWEIERSEEVALVGGHYEKLPRPNYFKMAFVGLKRLLQYGLLPAGKSVAFSVAKPLGYPQAVALLLLALAAALALRRREAADRIE
jgi:uncharacterized protein YycO